MNGDGCDVPMLSHAFLCELLTSQTRPPERKFDALSSEAIKMHLEADLVEQDAAPHDRALLGSPSLGLRPKHVRYSSHERVSGVSSRIWQKLFSGTALNTQYFFLF